MRLSLALCAAALALLPASAAASKFPTHYYKLTGLSMDSQVSYDHSGTYDDAIGWRSWGEEHTQLTLHKAERPSPWVWDAQVKGPLRGTYDYATDIASEHCSSDWDVSSHEARAGINIVPQPRNKVLVAFGANLATSENGFLKVSNLLDGLHQACNGDYLSAAVAHGATRSFIGEGIVGGRCDGYAVQCVVVPRKRFSAPTVKLGVTGATRTILDSASGISYEHRYSWSATLKRGRKLSKRERQFLPAGPVR